MKKEILFNLILIILVVCLSLVVWLFSDASNVPLNLYRVIDVSTITFWQRAIVGFSLLATILILYTLVLGLVWNKVATKVLNVNRISYSEAYSVSLLFAFISGVL